MFYSQRVFDYEEGRLIRWTAGTYVNHFQRSFDHIDFRQSKDDLKKMLQIVRELLEERPPTKEDTKQTLVNTIGHYDELIKSLRRIQDEKNWDVIHFCVDQGWCDQQVYEWFPIHQVIKTKDEE